MSLASSRANSRLHGTERQELHRLLIGDNRLFCAPKLTGQIIFQPRLKPVADRLTVPVAAYPTAANSAWHRRMGKQDQSHWLASSTKENASHSSFNFTKLDRKRRKICWGFAFIGARDRARVLHEFGLASLRVPHQRCARQFAHRSFACAALLSFPPSLSIHLSSSGWPGWLAAPPTLLFYTSTPDSCRIRQEWNNLSTDFSIWLKWA